jgi:hypothetical protein
VGVWKEDSVGACLQADVRRYFSSRDSRNWKVVGANGKAGLYIVCRVAMRALTTRYKSPCWMRQR